MIAMRFYSDLFQGISDSIRLLVIDYTPIIDLSLHIHSLSKAKADSHVVTDLKNGYHRGMISPFVF